jgi:hypothetical protein
MTYSNNPSATHVIDNSDVSNNPSLLNYYNNFIDNIGETNRISKGIHLLLKDASALSNPMVMQRLYHSDGTVKAIVDRIHDKAFQETPLFLFEGENKNISQFQKYISLPIDYSTPSIKQVLANSSKAASICGSSFLLLRVKKKSGGYDDLSKPICDKDGNPINIDDFNELHEDNIGGSLYPVVVDLPFNNRLDIAQALDQFEINPWSYLEKGDKDKNGINRITNAIKNILKLKDNDCNGFEAINKEISDNVKTYFKLKDKVKQAGKDYSQTITNTKDSFIFGDTIQIFVEHTTIPVHVSRLILKHSSNTPSGILFYQNRGYGYSMIQTFIEPILNILSLYQAITDLASRASIIYMQYQKDDTGNMDQKYGIAKIHEKILEKFDEINKNKATILLPPGLELKQMMATFTGWQDMLDGALQQLSMCTGLTKTELIGIGQGGYSNGNDVESVSASRTVSFREHFMPIDMYVYKMIYANKYNDGKYEALSIEYENPIKPSPEEDLKKQQMQIDVLNRAMEFGAIDRTEYIEQISKTGLFKDGIKKTNQELLDTEKTMIDKAIYDN